MLCVFRIQRVEDLLNDWIVLLENAVSDGGVCVCTCVLVKYLLRRFEKVVFFGEGVEASNLVKLHCFEWRYVVLY